MTYSKLFSRPLAAVMLSAIATTSGALTPDPETGLIPVRVPTDLCAFEERLPRDLVRQMLPRSDLSRLVDYMLRECPELALEFADIATATVGSTTFGDDNDDSVPVGGGTGGGGTGGGGTGGGGTGGGGTGGGGTGGGGTGGGGTGGGGTGGGPIGDPGSKNGRGHDVGNAGGNDKDRGHGNDPDGVDEDNPGNGGGGPNGQK